MLSALKKKLADKDITLICESYFDVPFGVTLFYGAVSVESLYLRYTGDNDELYFRDYLIEHPDDIPLRVYDGIA